MCRSSQDKPVLNWSPNPQEKIINLILIGAQGLSSDLVQEIRVTVHLTTTS